MAKLKLKLKRNASTILTVLAAVGVVATALLSAKDTPKAMKRVKKATKEKGEPLTKVEMVMAAAPAYIPTATITVTTVVCIFGINVMSRKSQASLASAYALLDRSYKDYRRKAVELYGEDADDRICDAIAEEKYLEQKPQTVSQGMITIYDPYTEQFFEAFEVDIAKAESHINRNLSLNGYVSLDDFYDCVGFDQIDRIYDMGWSAERMDTYGYWIYIELIPCRGNGTADHPEYYRLKFHQDPEPDFMYNYENYYGYGTSQKLQIM